MAKDQSKRLNPGNLIDESRCSGKKKAGQESNSPLPAIEALRSHYLDVRHTSAAWHSIAEIAKESRQQSEPSVDCTHVMCPFVAELSLELFFFAPNHEIHRNQVYRRQNDPTW